jgi:hypothetical protein
MEWSVEEIKLHTIHMGKYSGDFILYNLPELFQGCEKMENLQVANSPPLPPRPYAEFITVQFR